MARESTMLIAALLVAGCFSMVVADQQFGDITVSDTAASYNAVSEQVCAIFDAMDFEPYDWAKVLNVYTQDVLMGGKITSLEELATEGSAVFTGKTPEVYNEFATYFDDTEWINTGTLMGIEGEFAVRESDGAREELVQKYPRDVLGTTLVLGMFQTAIDEYKDGDTDAALEDIYAAWVLFYGYTPDGQGCAPYGTAESRARNFGFEPSDVVESTVAAFTAAIDALTGDSDDAESILEDSYMAIEMGFLKTYMRAAIRYANKMDGDAEADDGLNLRVNQLEGYAFANAILPYAATFDEEAAANIAAAFEPTMYAPVGEDNSVDLSAYTETLPVVLENVEAIMAAAGVDDDAFGVLSS